MSSGRIPSVEGGIQPTVVDAKGDLIVATAADTVSRLAVGSNGDTLVADSTTTTGLRWQADWNTGKNKIINGDFGIWQRGTSFSATGFTADRFKLDFGGTGVSATVTRQTFTPGSAPVAGYEGQYFSQIAATSGSDANTYITYEQKIEDVRNFAGQTITVSLWAKATSGTPKLGLELIQNFNNSSNLLGIGSTSVTLSTNWTRYSFTYSVPSLTGKTLDATSNLVINFWLSAGSNLASRSGSVGLQSNTFQVWGVQAEAGNVATAFTTATGTIQGELAACQRYYFKKMSGDLKAIGTGSYYSSTELFTMFDLPVEMRTTPTLDATSGTNYYRVAVNGTTDAFNGFSLDGVTTATRVILFTSANISGTAGWSGMVLSQNASASVALTAEL